MSVLCKQLRVFGPLTVNYILLLSCIHICRNLALFSSFQKNRIVSVLQSSQTNSRVAARLVDCLDTRTMMGICSQPEVYSLQFPTGYATHLNCINGCLEVQEQCFSCHMNAVFVYVICILYYRILCLAM